MLLFSFLPTIGLTQPTKPVTGLWKTIDDETGKAKSIVEIFEKNGKIFGRIKSLINPSRPNPLCTKCDGERKDQPITGMQILWDMQAAKDSGEWQGGRIFSPQKGKDYRAKLKLLEEGKKLQVKGCWGPFCRKQIWHRAGVKTAG